MSIIKDIDQKLWDEFHGYEDVLAYIEKWHEVYDDFGDNENFRVFFKDNEGKKIDLRKTLHNIEGETLLRIAIDLGVATPDFIPSIPVFRNEVKSSYETAAQTFEKAFHNVEKDPSIAIGLANSALESIIKEILKDSRVQSQYNPKDTLYKLTSDICKAFEIFPDASCPAEVKTIASGLLKTSKGIEDLRSGKTEFHGKTGDSYLVTEPIYAYFVVNAVTTVGLFLLSFYKTKFPPVTPQPFFDDNELPF